MSRSELEPIDSCENTVAKPTITSIKLYDKTITPAVQWYGEAERKALVPERQFLFPLSGDHLNYPLVKHPERYEVVFIGQIKDWPRPNVTEQVANALARGNMEEWVIWVVTPGLHDSKNSICISLGFGLTTIMDPNVGIITPKPHVDQGLILDALSRKLNAFVVHRSREEIY